jgi:predicted DNA-binding transcriptional regulator YafY
MAKETASVPQAKLVRLLNLINRLSVDRLTIQDIVHIYDVSQRTAYRYIKILEAAELEVEQDFHNKYYIINKESYAN